ncbi:MAG: stage III sporulation protein AA [Clostridiales bacterium]|jgi:stage III sporulation protein AA|nr:stage III sporulation protein AA [Clostridiales bacterium]
MSAKEIILSYLGKKLHGVFETLSEEFFAGITEIRIRTGKPLILLRAGREYFLEETGRFGELAAAYQPCETDIQETLALISDYSLYAFEEELRSGYITLTGGHRVGVVGRAVLENSHLRGLKNISGFNIRISHEVKGCADAVIESLTLPRPRHSMIISPPGCGKTTLLRDIIRQLSNGRPGQFPGLPVGVVDERSEIAGCYRGVPQNDVGCRTDVLDGCPKAEGMIILLRSMSPRVIAVDELGSRADIQAVEDIVNAGVTVVCTVHGRDLEDIRQKKTFQELLAKNIFERFVTLKGQGKLVGVFTEAGRPV